MKKSVYTEIEGVQFVLCVRDFPKPGDPDLWMPSHNWDGPSEPRPISEWPDVITQWEIEKQKAAGFTVWRIEHDNPKYWSKGEAVYRNDPTHTHSTHTVIMRNGAYDHRNFYSLPRGKVSMDTPEVEAAIEAARDAYKVAIDAGKKYKDAVRAIPNLTVDEWMKLPAKEE